MTRPTDHEPNNTLDKATPPQGIMNGDAAATGGNTVSLLNRGHGTAGSSGGNGASGNPGATSPGFRRWLGVIVGAVVVIALVAIGIFVFAMDDDRPNPNPSPQPTVSAPTSSSPSATPTASAEQAAIAGATKGYTAWRSTQDRVAMSGGADAPDSLLASVASGKQLDVDRFIAKTYYKERGRRMVKAGTVVSITPASVGTPDTTGTITAITLTVCRDVSKAVILQKGKPTNTPSSPTHLVDTAKMALLQGHWKATDVSNKPVKGACS